MKQDGSLEPLLQKIIFDFIDDKCAQIKKDREYTYIFNYKLLNELLLYYPKIKEEVIKWKPVTYSDTIPNYESVLELYYYSEQLKKSLDNINKINGYFKNKQPFFEADGDFSNTIASAGSSIIDYNSTIINNYNELIASFAQVLTYVKERNDGTIYRYGINDKNPRYKIELSYIH
jgi:hypothetical protein